VSVRLKDIAEATGFSVNTVSHALRDAPDIAEETKRYIREVADRLDYIPNLRAGSMKSGKSRIVSVILPDIGNPHFTIMFREIERYFSALGMTPFFINTAENGDAEINAVRLSIGQNVDGVLLCPTQTQTESIRLLEKSKIPFVLVGRRFAEINTDYAVCDDTEGARIATEYLLSLGHRKIAFVRVNEHISSDRERFSGYCRALADAGFSNERLILPLTLTEEQNRDAIRAFLLANPDVSAILAFNDMLAYSIIRAANEIGRPVPESLSVIGFDHIASDYPLPLELTSVSVAKKHIARSASELLYDRIQGTASAEKQHLVLPTKLEIGETTAKLKE